MSLQHSQIILSKLKLALTFRIYFFQDDGHDFTASNTRDKCV